MSINQQIKSAFWTIEDKGFEVLHSKSIKPFENEKVDFEDKRVAEAVEYHNKKWFHNEIVVKAKNATVEPQYAYAIDGLNTLIGASIRTRENLPSPIPMVKAKFFGKKARLPKAILFDGSMGINYFHFISDVLHKIYLLEDFIKLDCPILVGSAVWPKPFFQFLIQNTELSNLNWQRIDQCVEVDELYISRPLPYGNEYWRRTKELFISADKSVADKSIFINRTGTRHITNFSSIKPILAKHGVGIVDPGSSSMQEQAELFHSATRIIGIHGAGMTNTMFCDSERTKVLELCSNNRIGTQYYWLCTALGIDWDMMLGSQANPDQSFEINPELFEKRLESFLAS